MVVQPLWDSLERAVIVTDRNLDAPGPTILYVNPAFTRLTGYRADEVIGRTPHLLQSPRTDPAAVVALKRGLLDQGATRATLLIRRKDGTEYLCALVIAPLLGPTRRADHFICVAHDLREEALRERAQRISDEHEQSLTLIDDLEARQSEAEAIIARQRHKLRLLGDRCRAAQDRNDDLSTQLALRERALDLRCLEFARSEAELHATLEELRAMDEELRITLAEIEASNLKLERANEDLRLSQAANTDKLRLLATASHDLRQPVMAMGLFLDVLRNRMGPNERPVIGALMAAHSSVRTLLDGMLDTARLDAGVLDPVVSAVPMAAILEDIRREFALEAEIRGLRFRVPECSAVVVSDRQLLQRILHNLIANALKYTERGRILVGCRRCGAHLRIEVWDSGPGIPEASRRKIFDEFQQLDNPDRDQRRGVGLGLSIVARLAQRLGHRIGLRSRVGRGSIFSLTVPLASVSGALESRGKEIRNERARSSMALPPA